VKTIAVTSSTVLTITVSVASNAQLGSGDVSVTVPGSGTAVCSGCFTVNPGPTISTVSPTTLARGQATVVDIVGTQFNTGATVAVSGTGVTAGAVTRVDATHLRVTLTVASSAATGARSITVTNTDAGKTTATNAVSVT
jgi:hypothetical protein